MSQKISHLSSIGRVFLTYIALMVIQNGCQSNVEGANILSKYKSGYNVDKFLELIENDARASNQCKNEITIFSPTDGAIKAFKKPIDHQIIMNGMVNTAFDITNILNLGR